MRAHRLQRTIRSVTILSLGILVGVASCGGDSAGLVPVSGKVFLEGQPLPRGSVSYRPDASRGNKSLHHPTGEIDAQGNYELMTVGKKGAPPGRYKVLVFAAEPTGPGPYGTPAMPRWLHDVRYTSEETTNLSVEVVAQPSSGAYDLKLRKESR